MQTIMFSTYDSKAKTFSAPFTMLTIGMAIRGFEEAAKNPETMLNRYPNDFSLYEIGTYDDSNATFQPTNPINLLSIASEFVKKPTVSPETVIDETTRKMHSDQIAMKNAREEKFKRDEKKYFATGEQPTNNEVLEVK